MRNRVRALLTQRLWRKGQNAKTHQLLSVAIFLRSMHLNFSITQMTQMSGSQMTSGGVLMGGNGIDGIDIITHMSDTWQCLPKDEKHQEHLALRGDYRGTRVFIEWLPSQPLLDSCSSCVGSCSVCLAMSTRDANTARPLIDYCMSLCSQALQS